MAARSPLGDSLACLRRQAAVASAIIGAACGGGQVQSAASPVGTVACGAAPFAAPGIDSAVVVVTSQVALTKTPRATTFGETFVFALIGERPDFMDCRGRSLGAASYIAREGGSSTINLDPVDPGARPRLTVLSASETRARDLVDAGFDLLITDSPSLATYAANRPDAISIPLGYDRTWAVALPRPGALAIDSTLSFRESVARDVVRSDARPATAPFWWSDLAGCPTTPRPLGAARGSSRIVYSLDDPVAKALAERVVALANAGVTSAGLAPNAFASALRAANELAYVLPLERSAHDRCQQVDNLLAKADWLGGAGSVVPLIDTRLRAVARRGRLNLIYTRDSSITIIPTSP